MVKVTIGIGILQEMLESKLPVGVRLYILGAIPPAVLHVWQ